MPRLHLPGGVAYYYSTVRPYFSDAVTYANFGSQTVAETERGTNIRRLLKDYWVFWRELRRAHYDVVHLNPSLSTKCLIRDAVFLMLAKAMKRPVVVFVRGWDVSFQKRLERYWAPFFKLVWFRASACIVLADEFRRVLRRMGYSRPIFVETTTVDDRLIGMRPSVGQARRFNILFLARLEKGKGPYEVIDTFRILKLRYPEVTLTIAGDGPEYDSIRSHLALRPDVDIALIGHVTSQEKHSAFITADVYFLPTHDEGMPNSVLEAMAYGLPVVTRPVGGLRDFFQHGTMGFSSESHDPSVFASYIETLLLDRARARRMGECNREYAREHFVASKVAVRLERIYREVLMTSDAPPIAGAARPVALN